MCWFTLTPIKDKKRKRSSYAEDLVRVHHKARPRFSGLKVKVPSSITMDLADQNYHHHSHLHPFLQHHHRHHLHPLHLHPIHGSHQYHNLPEIPSTDVRRSGRKRGSPPPGPPPPSRDSNCGPRSRTSSPVRATPCESIYRTQIVEPATIRETTRVALRNVQSNRQQNRLRRVAGYEALGRDMPWQWDCVSSTAGSSSAGGRRWAQRKGRGGLKYPPFGTVEKWL